MRQSQQSALPSETHDDQTIMGHPLAIKYRGIVAAQEAEIERYRERVLTLRSESRDVRARIHACGQSGDYTDLLNLRTRDEELEAEIRRFAATADRMEFNLRSVRHELAKLEKFEERR